MAEEIFIMENGAMLNGIMLPPSVRLNEVGQEIRKVYSHDELQRLREECGRRGDIKYFSTFAFTDIEFKGGQEPRKRWIVNIHCYTENGIAPDQRPDEPIGLREYRESLG